MTKHEAITAPDNDGKPAAHQSVFAAIAAAVAEVKVLGKSDRNKFDGYDFVSIDKFLALVNPICARHGLFPIVALRELEQYENVNSKGGKSVWGRFFYDITLFHASGDKLGPVNIMVSVPLNGAQASGSAQSYALKQFFRATLMIATGDKDDADLIPTEQHHAPQVQPVSAGQFTKLRDLARAAGVTEQEICAKVGASSLEQFPANRFDAVAKGLQSKIDAAKPSPSEQVTDDEIPY
ncbi:ERF family protein [Leisingera sp. SS27]|uniref:ERF family protein n=1 Tax=Leisingera sp. SS27 TaxID=2979462 RepID=UPI00233063C8|nr:ERF family protein [Leisingera sp. SS27]MDC0657082.1 ERF family protein [Leisingera sp. SS27]